MNSATGTPCMARKAKRNDIAVKIDADAYRDLRIVAAYEDKELAELLSEIAGPVLKKRRERHERPPKSE